MSTEPMLPSRRLRPLALPRMTPGSLRRLGAAQGGGLFVALILLSVYFSAATGSFFTTGNLLTILEQIAVLGMVAVPGAMLVLSGNLDLSVGSVAGLSAAMFGEFAKILHWPLALSVVGALAVGALWGAMNGVLICYYRFSPVVVTLGGFAGAAGLAQTITSDKTRSGFGNAFSNLGDGTVAGVPVPGLLFAVVFLIGVYIWYGTAVGRHLTAIGANKTAAESLGLPTKRLSFTVYVFSGLAAAFGGLIITSELDGASVQIGLGLELQVLTAILLGGVAFNGGRGSLWGTLAGILFIGVLDDGLILVNVGPYVANLAVGGALVVAAALDVLYQRLERLPASEPKQVGSPESQGKPIGADRGPHKSELGKAPTAATTKDPE